MSTAIPFAICMRGIQFHSVSSNFGEILNFVLAVFFKRHAKTSHRVALFV